VVLGELLLSQLETEVVAVIMVGKVSLLVMHIVVKLLVVVINPFKINTIKF